MVKPRLTTAFILLMAFTFLLPQVVMARTGFQGECDPSLIWQEVTTEHFSIIYSTAYRNLAKTISSEYGTDLDRAFENYSAAFKNSLVAPISIRIYPNLDEYYCLNAFGTLLDKDVTHSHIGLKEISIIGDAIMADSLGWQPHAMNGLYHELAILFAKNISDGEAPKGLLLGIGGYAENPLETFETRFEDAGGHKETNTSWQFLWEGTYLFSDHNNFIQSTSIVAFLVDVYGWDDFLFFLSALSESDGYRQSLKDTYGKGLTELQAEWQNYYKAYVDQRWQAHVFYSYDLAVYEELILAGAYSDALKGLQEAVFLISIFGDDASLTRAQELETKAQLGVEAGALVSQARTALLGGDYKLSVELAERALVFYTQLGDAHRIEELETYLSIAQEVIDLREEVEAIQDGGIGSNPTTARRLAQIGERLGELGDQEGMSQASIVLAMVVGGNRFLLEGIVLIGVIICVFLILRRIRAARKPIPPEADLL